MKKLISIFCGMLIVFLLGSSCEKETSVQVTMDWQLPQLKSNINDYGELYAVIFEDAYNSYPLSVFCACDCGTSDAVQSVLNKHMELLGVTEATNLSCSDFFDGVGYTCSQDVNQVVERLLVEIEEAYNSSYILSGEAELIKDLLHGITTEPLNVDFNSYMLRYDNLALDGSATFGLIPYSLIISSQSAFEYFKDFPPPAGVGPTTFIVNKLLGGLFGAWANAMYWTWDHRDCLSCSEGEGLGREMARGAVAGAIGSI